MTTPRFARSAPAPKSAFSGTMMIGARPAAACAPMEALKEQQAGAKQHGHMCLCLFQGNQACMQVSPGPEVAVTAEQCCCSSAISAAFLHSSSALLTSPDTAATCAEGTPVMMQGQLADLTAHRSHGPFLLRLNPKQALFEPAAESACPAKQATLAALLGCRP